LLDRLGDRFTVLTINADAPAGFAVEGLELDVVSIGGGDDATGAIANRYLGDNDAAVYLIRPDQHVAARWPAFDAADIDVAVQRVLGKA
jgi:3-(3-hydroxy-phenyl)propionate hydroxylase